MGYQVVGNKSLHLFVFQGFDVEFQWFDKTSTRMPEAFLLDFRPAQPNMLCAMSKLHQPVDPLNVLQNGSQYQHGKLQRVHVFGCVGMRLFIVQFRFPLTH